MVLVHNDFGEVTLLLRRLPFFALALSLLLSRCGGRACNGGARRWCSIIGLLLSSCSPLLGSCNANARKGDCKWLRLLLLLFLLWRSHLLPRRPRRRTSQRAPQELWQLRGQPLLRLSLRRSCLLLL